MGYSSKKFRFILVVLLFPAVIFLGTNSVICIENGLIHFQFVECSPFSLLQGSGSFPVENNKESDDNCPECHDVSITLLHGMKFDLPPIALLDIDTTLFGIDRLRLSYSARGAGRFNHPYPTPAFRKNIFPDIDHTVLLI